MPITLKQILDLYQDGNSRVCIRNDFDMEVIRETQIKFVHRNVDLNSVVKGIRNGSSGTIIYIDPPEISPMGI